MERDFMGLNSKDHSVVKEEFDEGGCEYSGFSRSSSMSWPSSNKNWLSAHPIHDVKMHPFSMMSPFLKTHFMGACQKFGGANSHAAPHAFLPSAAFVAGTSEQWINSKASGVPAQLTIFYGGTVNVFDDISPEKAQAIMLLAGHAYVQSNMTQQKLQMQAPASKLPASDQALVNQTKNAPPCSGFPSPMSVSSHRIDQYGVAGANNDDIKVTKAAGMSTTLVDTAEHPRVISPIGSVAASAIMSSAVPQARKASLARFLEKRKERVMSAAPYSMSSKAADCATPESADFGFSATSGICSSSHSVSKED